MRADVEGSTSVKSSWSGPCEPQRVGLRTQYCSETVGRGQGGREREERGERESERAREQVPRLQPRKT